MDPLAIAASACSIAALCGSIISKVCTFIADVQAVPQALQEFNTSVTSLKTVLSSIDDFLSKKPKFLPFAQKQEYKHWQDVRNVLDASSKCLHRLQMELPDPPTVNSSKFLQQARIQLELSVKSNVVTQIRGHISSYTQILQLSLTTLSLGSIIDTQQSQDAVRLEIQKLTSEIRETNAIIQRRQLETQTSPGDDFTHAEMLATRRNIEAWRESAESLAVAVTLYDPDQESIAERAHDAAVWSDMGLGGNGGNNEGELNEPLERIGPTLSVGGPEMSMSNQDSGVEVDETASDWDPEPENDYFLSVDIIQRQIAANRENVTKLINEGLYFQAEQYQAKRIELQDQLLRAHKIPFPDRPDAEEILADILRQRKTKESIKRAKEIYKRLLQQEVERGGLATGEEKDRRWRLYHKLGEVYIELGFHPKAKDFATRALVGRKQLAPYPKELILDTAHLLANACQLNQDFDEASGIRDWIRQQEDNGTTSQSPDDVSPNAVMADVLRWCKGRGFDVDSPDFYLDKPNASGKTPLHIAISEEALVYVKEIVDHVKTLETVDHDNCTALLLACSTQNNKTTSVLLRKGSKVGVQDNQLNSPLHRVQRSKGGTVVAKLLLGCQGHPINIDQKNIYDKTALHLACEMGNEAMVDVLLNSRADPNCPGPAGCTPLHVAIDSRRVTIVKTLLERGADITIRDRSGRDAVRAARTTQHRSPEITKLVQEHEHRAALDRRSSDLAALRALEQPTTQRRTSAQSATSEPLATIDTTLDRPIEGGFARKLSMPSSIKRKETASSQGSFASGEDGESAVSSSRSARLARSLIPFRKSKNK